LYAITPGEFEQLNAHDGIIVEESARVVPIGTDAAHHSCKVKENLRACIGKELLNSAGSRQIVIALPGNENVVVSAALQLLDDK
jgi:hypothetical protein